MSATSRSFSATRTSRPHLYAKVATSGLRNLSGAATPGSEERVFVSTDHDVLPIANQRLREGRPFRMIWWRQMESQRILST